MDIETVVKVIKALDVSKAGECESFIEVGKCYLFRCVTYHQVGRVRAINANEIILEDASWVANSGLFAPALKTGKLEETEYTGVTGVKQAAIVDWFPWDHELPK